MTKLGVAVSMRREDWDGEEDVKLVSKDVLKMGGALFHVEAHRATKCCDVCGVWDYGEEGNAIHAAQGNSDPWETVKIGGLMYVLVITPFCT